MSNVDNGHRRPAGSAMAWCMAALIYAGVLLLAPMARLIGGVLRLRRPPRGAQRLRLLLVGTFFTRNWCRSHLAPLVRCLGVTRIDVIADGPIEPMSKVVFHQPPPWARSAVARALWKAWLAARQAVAGRPHVVMGYHLLPCGMIALLAARLVNARSVYQLTGGPTEIEGGGHATENFLLRRLGGPSPVLEWLVTRIADRFDLLVPRGARGRDWLMERKLGRIVRIIPGSVPDPAPPTTGPRDIDMVAVCRLVPIKQLDQMVRVAAAVAERRPGARLVILGDGPARHELRRLAEELGVAAQVELRGHVEDVAAVLSRSKVFLLTSRSEGLSIAMAEAMACGVVPIVADVGDLGELVHDGETGYRITPGDIAAHAEAVCRVLDDGPLWQRLSAAAHALLVAHNGLSSVARRWELALRDVMNLDDRADSAAPMALKQQIFRRLPRIRSLMGPVGHMRSPDAWLGRCFQQVISDLEQSETWCPDETEAHQTARLRALLRHAYEKSLFHRQRMEAAGFHPEQLSATHDMSRLPTMSAEDVRAAGDALLTVPAGSANVNFVSTGGTGGRPLRMALNADRSTREYAHLVAGWQRAGYDFSHALAIVRGNEGATGPKLFRHDPFLRRYQYNGFDLHDEALNRLCGHLATIGPCFLLTYPSTAGVIARFLQRSGRSIPPNVRGLLAGSENLYPRQRAALQEAFGLRCFSWYGLTEKVALATECEYSDDMHVWPTYGFVELLDEDGRQVTVPGRRGEIVATGFFNTVSPLIRYRTGDQATYVGESCPACGRSHLLLRDIRGHRTQETLVSRRGGLIPWTAINVHDDTFAAVRQFQFVQNAPGVAELRIVPAGLWDAASQSALMSRIGRRLDDRLDITLRLVDHIPQTHRGKATYVLQGLDLDAFRADEEALSA